MNEQTAVNELRRLHALNAELLNALKELVNGSGFAPASHIEKARAAITKAEATK